MTTRTDADRDAEAPRRFTLDDGRGLQLRLMDLGATCLGCTVTLPDGSTREVMLGHAAPADHGVEPGYLGGVIGRYANRIAKARFALDGREHVLAANEGPHQLHGGPDGFNRRRWDVVSATPRALHFRLRSPDGDQGFPGALEADVRYLVSAPGTLRIEFEATCSAPCPVNLTSHAYFDLDGHRRGVHAQRLQIAAARFVAIDAALVPTGALVAVEGTPFDFRTPHAIGQRLHEGEQQRLAGGYDHCHVLDAACASGRAPAARVWSGDGRLSLTLSTSYPGLQFYSGNQLPRTRGVDGRPYAAHAGLALEPQYLPNSPNHPEWPQPGPILRPGERLRHFIEWRFDTHASAESASPRSTQ